MSILNPYSRPNNTAFQSLHMPNPSGSSHVIPGRHLPTMSCNPQQAPTNPATLNQPTAPPPTSQRCHCHPGSHQPNVPVRQAATVTLFIIWLYFLAVSPAVSLAAPEYLRHEKLTLIPDGREVSTSLPLDPSKKYHVLITSPYTLRALLRCKERASLLFTLSPMCWPSLYVNGEPIAYSTSRHHDSLAVYFYEERTTDYFRPRIDLYIWGTGKPLKLQAMEDFTDAIPKTTVEVIDSAFQANQELLAKQHQQEMARIEEERRQELARIEAERRQKLFTQQEIEKIRVQNERIRQAERALEIERAQARLREEEAEAKQRRYLDMLKAVFTTALLVAVAAALLVVAVLFYKRRTLTIPKLLWK